MPSYCYWYNNYYLRFVCVPVFMVSRRKYPTVFVIYWAVNASLQLSTGCPNGPCCGILTDLSDSCIISANTQTLILFCFSPLPDSDPAPLPKCCEGHPAGRPVFGEFLLTGGGASQQARGGGQVGLSGIWPGVRICCLPPPFSLPHFCTSPFFLLPSSCLHHPHWSCKFRRVQTCFKNVEGKWKKRITQTLVRLLNLAGGGLAAARLQVSPHCKVRIESFCAQLGRFCRHCWKWALCCWVFFPFVMDVLCCCYRSSKELLLQPVLISRNEKEKVLIEGSINSVRVSIAVKQVMEKICVNELLV